MPHTVNKEIDSNFGTETHRLGQTKGHSKMIKEWMPQPILTKTPRDNVNPDSMNIQQQQMDFYNRNNYITSQEKQIHRTREPEVAVSTANSLPDDLCECTQLLAILAVIPIEYYFSKNLYNTISLIFKKLQFK